MILQPRSFDFWAKKSHRALMHFFISLILFSHTKNFSITQDFCSPREGILHLRLSQDYKLGIQTPGHMNFHYVWPEGLWYSEQLKNCLGFLLFNDSTGHKFTAVGGTRRANISKQETQVNMIRFPTYRILITCSKDSTGYTK